MDVIIKEGVTSCGLGFEAVLPEDQRKLLLLYEFILNLPEGKGEIQFAGGGSSEQGAKELYLTLTPR